MDMFLFIFICSNVVGNLLMTYDPQQAKYHWLMKQWREKKVRKKAGINVNKINSATERTETANAPSGMPRMFREEPENKEGFQST